MKYDEIDIFKSRNIVPVYQLINLYSLRYLWCHQVMITFEDENPLKSLIELTLIGKVMGVLSRPRNGLSFSILTPFAANVFHES